MSKEKALIEEVYPPSKGQTAPVLLKFQNGDLTTATKSSTLYFPVKSDQDKKIRSVVIASGNVYTGTNGEGGVANELTDTYICVRNKTTNKVRVLPIDQVKLINQIYQEKEQTKFAALSKENSYAIAMRNFGGRRDMRFLASQERNKVNIDVVQEQLESTVEASSVLETTDEIVSAEDNVERIRPPFNKEATILENVYTVTDIIPPELLDRLDEEAKALLGTDVNDIPISSDYLKNIIKSLKNAPESKQTLMKLKMIIYMDALQTLMLSREKILKRMEISKITEKVENDIRDRFSDMNLSRQVRNSFSNEKALCYYLVLGFLLSEKYQLDLDIISLDVRMPKKKLVRLGSLVNAIRKANSNYLVLRLPSNMPPLNFTNKYKKKIR